MKTLITLLPLSLPSSCLWFLLFSSLCNICFCDQNLDHVLCIPSERSALIDLKNNFTDESNLLSSWTGKDCCSWSGVVCDNITGHVHELHLRGPDDGLLGGTVSPSVTKLLQLKHLDLSNNDFGGSLIPACIGSLQNIMYLNLSKSNFSGEIPQQLGNLSTLRVLDLHNFDSFYYTHRLYSKSLKWLKNLKRLQHLDMGGIDLEKASDWLLVISNLTSLLELKLSSCWLDSLPSNLTTYSFTSLVVLDLSHNYFFHSMLPGWIFNLRNLAVLDLSYCDISGVNYGTRGGFHSMPSLRTLRVSGNAFVNSSWVLNELSSLSKLRLLDVSECGISSPILRKLENLSLLERVYVSNNQIVEEIPKSLSSICNIITLDLSSNKIYGNASELLEGFCECESPKLELLALYDNHLTGQLPERLGKMKNLINIDLRNNNLTGSIPDTIGCLSILERLNLSFNMLNGSLPESVGRLSKLQGLALTHNSLTGILTENHFANLTALKALSVGYNKWEFKVSVNDWIPPFNLIVFSADYCNLGPQFPSWIQSQTQLIRLTLTNANISDTIPHWFWTTFTGSLLYLSNNNLHGKLPGDMVQLEELDISNNNLSGSLEQFLCSGIQEPWRLKVLNLANNNMSGVIPDCWMNLQDLVILNLEKNQFSGIIPPSLSNLSSLRSLDMDDNKLSGNLPSWILNSESLAIIELAENELMGNIPSSIGGNGTSLRLLSLRSNNFEGKIPDEICHLSSIQILDLAHNDLSGNLPRCFTNFSIISGSEISSPIVVPGVPIITNFPPMITASLVTKGNTYTYDTILYLVTSLDLSDNKFTGSIPNEFVELLGLRFLNLSHNDLTGTIPNLFSQNGQLESLDMSVNHLDGNIPSSLSQLTSLSFLNISYNNLVGQIPTGRQLQTFNESCFTGNALCGAPLPACLHNNGEGSTDKHDESNGMDWILVILTLAGLVVGFWIVLTPLFLSSRWRIAYYNFLEEIWFQLQNFIFLLFLRLTKRFRSRYDGIS